MEEVHVVLLRLGMGESLKEVVTIIKGLGLETGSLLTGERTLGLFDLLLQLTKRTDARGS